MVLGHAVLCFCIILLVMTLALCWKAFMTADSIKFCILCVLLIHFFFPWAGHYERPPYNEHTIRSVYHVREYDVHQLLQVEEPIDIFLSHDWPVCITDYGNSEELIRRKPYFKKEVIVSVLRWSLTNLCSICVMGFMEQASSCLIPKVY